MGLDVSYPERVGIPEYEVILMTELIIEAANRSYGLREPDERDVDWEYGQCER